MSKKHGKKIVSRKKFKIVDNLDTPEKRIEDQLFLIRLALDEYDEYLGGTLEHSISWYLMCSGFGLSSMQSVVLFSRLAVLHDASESGDKWTPHVHAHQGKHGLEIYARKDKSKREKGPAFDIAHIRMVMRSVMTKDQMRLITDDDVMRMVHTLQDIAAREEERDTKGDRKDGPYSPASVAFEDAKEYADPDALDDVDDDDGSAEAGIGIDVIADEEADFEASDDEEDAGVLAETGSLNESEAAEGLPENVADTDSNAGARGKESGTGSDGSNDVHGKHAQGNNPLSDIPELKRLDLGKGDKNK
ncbi:hypothetical protein PT279_01475 [Bifidobacterium sp. ESL0784]|uniref:hypothetical protein n=1 Tax=Bifidobacterium sp. ESL0784 TaxID=2983231 RepID=UPI0023F743E5|nr:hypothetical protein [Bifidobacterium sp. ESL0784]MDF7640269.1 hypothetical protein [Bifidobacterium sp. ESL0784]